MRRLGQARWPLALCAALAVAAFAASSAPAAVGDAPSHPGGIVPRRGGPDLRQTLPAAAHMPTLASNAAPINGAINPSHPLLYHGGPTMHAHTIHAIFWAPPGFSFPAGYQSGVEAFLMNVAADSGKTSSPYGTISQYTDNIGGRANYSVTYGGSVLVGDALPPRDAACFDGSTCITDAQLVNEADTVRGAQGWNRGLADQYLVLTPPSITTCFSDGSGICSDNAYCAYHGYAGSKLNPLVFLHVPFEPAQSCHTADGIVTQPLPNGTADIANDLISHEQREAATDPLLDAWYDDLGYEADDKCIDDYGTLIGQNGSFIGFNQQIGGGVYDTQLEWSNAKHGCYQMGPPKVTSISPASAAGGATVGITGENFFFQFGSTPAVRFNNVASPSVTVDSPTHLTAQVPPGNVGGHITVVGVGGSGTSTQVFGVQPTIATFSVDHGFTGTVVNVTGTGFFGVTSVKINGVAGTVSNVSAAGTSLSFTIPAAATTGAITVTTGGGTGSSALTAGTFTVDPKIISFTPASAAVGDVVTLAGSGFGASGETRSVSVNGIPARPGTSGFAATWVSPNSVKFAVPAGATTGPIVLTVGSALPFTTAAALKVVPKLTGYSVLAAREGDTVIVQGTTLFGATSLKFGAIAATIDSISSDGTQIATHVPAGALTGTVSVTTPGGSSTGPVFKVLPTVDESFAPTHGFTGTAVTVTGKTFTGTTSVKLGGVTAGFSLLSGQLKVTVPVGAMTGPISVTNAGGTTTTSNVFTVDPKITAFTPVSAAVGGLVTLSGSGFGGSGEPRTVSVNGTAARPLALFGGVPAATTWVSPNTLKFTVPAGATTGPIQLTVGGAAPFTTTSFLRVLPKVTGYSAPAARDGDAVTVQGTTLDGATSVKFGSVGGVVDSVSADGTQLFTHVPAGALTAAVTVTTPGGSSTGPVLKVLPTVAEPFAPTHGVTGTSVTLTGKTFTGTSSVKVGGVAAAYSLVSAQQLKVTVPAAAVTGPISVTNAGGTTTTAGMFTVDPRITGFTPTSAVVGGLVTLSGSGFGGAGETRTLTVNGIAARSGVAGFAVTWVSPNSLKFTVPAGATSGVIQLTVGSAAPATTAAPLKVLPSVTGYSLPAAREGDPVTVQGTTLVGATSLKFGTIAAGIDSISPDGTAIATHVPVGALTGAVTVVTPSGTSTGPAFKVLPTVDGSFAPAHGVTGTLVTVTGKSFTGTTSVMVGGVSAAFSLLAGQLKVTVPAGAVTGPISVTNAGGTTTTSNTFTVDPKIASFTPESASVGDLVTLTGSGFGASGEPRSVTVNGLAARSGRGVGYAVTWVSPTSLKFTVPAGATTGPIVLTVGSALPATTAAPLKILPKVTGYASPAAREGDAVTVQGTTLDGATSLKFGTIVAGIDSVSPDGTTIQTHVPAGAVTGAVTVVTPGGTSVGPAFRVLPTVDESFSPTHGLAGTIVTVTGKTFTGTSSVKVGGVPATFALTSPTGMKVTIPAAAVTGPLSVTNAGGTTTTSNSFTVDARISSFAPTSGSTGVTVNVNGNGFGGADRVDFAGGVSAVPTNVTPTALKVVVPPGAATGPISVHTPAGSSPSSTTAFTVTFSVTSTSPTAGDYGTDVTVSGTGLTGVTAVKFNNLPGAVQPGGTATTLHVHVPLSGDVSGHITVWKGLAGVQAPQDFTLVHVASLAPTTGVPGTSITITGKGFTGATSVKLNGTAAAYTVDSDTQITARIPAGATTGTVTVTAAGASATSAGSVTVSDVSGVVINEFSTGTTADSLDDFVELYNTTPGTVDLSSCTLRYAHGPDVPVVLFPPDATPVLLLSHKWYVVHPTPDIDGAVDGGLQLTCGATTDDAVGWGTAPAFVEGTPTTAPALDGSEGRISDGADSNNNATDFTFYASPTPGSSNGP